MTRSLPRPLRLLILLLAVALTGCNAGARFAYNHLDRLALWKLGDYVTLDAPQKAAFRREFASIWTWHRSTQLPLYARDLRAFAATLEGGALQAEQIEAVLDTAEAHGQRLGQQFLPAAERLLPLMSDEQVRRWRDERREKIERDEAERRDETLEQRRKRYIKEQREGLADWIGKLNPKQLALIDAAWQAELPLLRDPGVRRQERLASLARYAALLDTRTQPGLAARIEAFDDGDSPAKARREAESARGRRLFVDLMQATDAPQRDKLRRRLLELAEDCEVLAREPASDPAAAS